ncbi:MAG: Flp pilus assembly complex ATPase component TadA, partial [Gammaproteobacteria bacterium]|nr:Flp pilus assembly complex ATPase component TadA [Gammaproteobacteria bacterium]
FTLEDPIEYVLPMIRQTPIKPDVGMNFAAGLRALLRQDPDVILVGEIRGLETAELAIRASLTGHLVLSTLHTNTAAGVIPRLIDMGAERYLLPSALNAVIGQRLVRKLCEHCKQPSENIQKTYENYNLTEAIPEDSKYYDAVGCEQCSQSGYNGRIAIYELLVIEENMHDAIINETSSTEIEAIAKSNGMKLMLENGLIKAAQGLTSVEEIVRVVR